MKALFLKDNNIIDFLEHIKDYLKEEHTYEELNNLKRTIKRKYNNFLKDYYEKYSEFKNMIIYPDDKPILIVGFYLNNFSKLKLGDILKLVLERYKKEFYKRKGEHTTLEEQIKIIYLAQAKYKFLDILKISNKTFHIFNFRQISRLSSNNTYYIEGEKEFKYVLDLYDINKKDFMALNKYAMFAYILGRIVNWSIIKDPEEAPYGFYRCLKRENLTLLVNNKRELPVVFGDIFAAAVLKDTEYNDNKLNITEGLINYLNSQISLYLDNKKEKEKVKEINDNDYCPCLSGLLYKNCCKKKKFKWVYSDNSIIKEMPIAKEASDGLKDFLRFKEEKFNRYIYGNEAIFSDMILLDMNFLKHIKKLRKLGIKEELLYAVYKTDRILTEKGTNLIPDREIEEWNDAIDEYRYLTKNDSLENMSILTYIRTCNMVMEKFFQKYYSSLSTVIDSYVAYFDELYDDYRNFQVKDLNSFLVFCARKMALTFESFVNCIDNNDEIGASSLLRALFEVLINIIVYMNDQNLFNEKILPLALLTKGEYEYLVTDKGFKSKTKVINPKTKKIYNVHITMSEMCEKAGENYKNLYDELFNDLSLYIHLNISSTKTFFKELEPFYELDAVDLASLIGIFIVNKAVGELAKLDSISDFIYRDMTYISDMIKEEMNDILELIINLDNDNNSIYKILQDLNSDYYIIK